MAYKSLELSYPYDGLEHYCDVGSVKLHHDVNHKAFMNVLNYKEEKSPKVKDMRNYCVIKHCEREIALYRSGYLLHSNKSWQTLTMA